MITPQEAEALARQHMADYVNSCACQTNEDVANVLMKLASVCGVSMCAVVGYRDAVARLEGVAGFIEESMADVIWKQDKAN